MKIAFFGSSKVSIYVLEELAKAGFIPACVVTTPDKPRGRGLVVTPNVVKTWASKENIKVYDPAKMDSEFEAVLKRENCDLFIVASYGKIIPPGIIDMPEHKTLNVHPSLLPKYRGAAPLQMTMLEDTKKTGITIMRLDEKVDHGPIVAQKMVTVDEWPCYEEFEEIMAREGGRLLAETIPGWVSGKIEEVEQDHSKATFTKKIIKEDALINLNDDPYLNFRKIQSYHEWPQAYFFADNNGRQIRVKITGASYADGKLAIEKVIPEGGKNMTFSDFLKGYKMQS